MSAKQFFYFVGDEPSTARSVSIDPAGDVRALRQAVASVLHIADFSGMLPLFYIVIHSGISSRY